MEDWIKDLFRKGNIHEFYTCSKWLLARRKALKKQNYECQECKKIRKVTKATTVHHMKQLKDRPDLALNQENLIALCRDCHEKIHGRRKEKFWNEERW